MIKVKFLRTLRGAYELYEMGKVYELTPNEAHTFIELKYAESFKGDKEKGFEAPPQDKMMRKGKSKIRVK